MNHFFSCRFEFRAKLSRNIPKRRGCFSANPGYRRLNDLCGHLKLAAFLSVLLFSTGHLTAQSTNCNCTGSLLSNGTFEGGNLNGWSVSGSANVTFESGYDDCGLKSLRLSRGSGSGLLDPAIWQQENNIEVGKIYTLSFDAGTHDPSGIHRVYIRFYNAGGTLLSEDYLEVNHDVDSDNQLKSYNFSMAVPTNATYLRVEASLDQDKLYLDNLCLVKASCTAPTFIFQNPTLIAGSPSQVGAVYEFLNVVAGTNARMTIVGKTHADIVIESVDEPEATNGGYDWAFQPIIDYNYYNGGGANDPAGDKSVTFRFEFVDALTGELVYIPQLNVTGVDIDGNGATIREFIQASNFNYYEIQSPTELTLSGSLRALGNLPAWPGVTETALTTMISYVYNGQSSVEITYGSNYNGGSHSSDYSEKRMNCLYFKCYDFNTTVACPTVTVSGGNAVCYGNSLTLNASNSGGVGTCGFQWQSSLDGSNWTNIAGATGSSYTTPNLATTTHYRALFECQASPCGSIISNVTTASVLSTCAEICNNNIDDDGDGFIDEDDADCANFDICEPIPGENIITGTVFNDANTNLIFDNGEYTPAGVVINVYEDVNGNGSINANDFLVGTTQTDDNGAYSVAVEPIFDTNYDARISDPCNDARDGNESENRIQFGKDKDVGLRFTGINIPAGATINSAYLHFVSKNNQSKTGAVTIYGEKKKFPQSFCTNDDVNSRTRTTASVNWTVGNWSEDQSYQSRDIKTLVQELVNSFGTYSNSEMTFILISNGSENVEAKTFETNGSSAEAPRLVINFTAAGYTKYLVQVDQATLPLGTSLNTPNPVSVTFSNEGVADCNNNFGFTGSYEICDNGIDDDGDGFADCSDIKCFCCHDGEDVFLNGTINSNRLIPAGSYIVNMGVVPQTVNNALKPYGLIWELLHEEEVPVLWSINSNKTKDGVDFTYNGINYRGGAFIILPEYRTSTVNTIIANWESQGVIGLTTTTDFSAPIFRTLNYSMNWTLDQQNGSIAQKYLENAGIPSSAFNTASPGTLNCCNDVFVMPHADPTWATHGHLLGWNDCPDNGGCGGAIWAGCKAVSEMENVFNPSDPSQRLNFLMLDPIAPANNPAVWSGDHSDGSMDYVYHFDNHPIMQFMGTLDGAQEGGAEQVYLPTNGWRPTTLVGIEDASHPDIVQGSGSVAAKLAFGYAFGLPDRGYVVYEGGHDVSGNDPENIAAQRAFLNFSFMSVFDKAIRPVTALPDIMYSGNEYVLSVVATGGSGNYNYSWTSNCGGTFQNANSANATFIPPSVTENTECQIHLLITDDCGTRKSFETVSIEIQPVPPEICDNNIDDDGDGLIDCEDPDCGNSISIVMGAVPDVCPGYNTPLSVSVSTTVGSPFSYTWSHGLGNGSSKIANPSVTTTYSVTVTGANGCQAIGETTVIVLDCDEICDNGIDDDGDGLVDCLDPDCSQGLSAAITGLGGSSCPGIDQQLTASGTGGTMPYTFKWSNGLGSGATKTVSPVESSTYIITLTDKTGCTANALVSVDIQPCPEDCTNGIDDDLDNLTDCEDPDCNNNLTVTISGGGALCKGGSLTLTAAATGGNGSYAFTWSDLLGGGTTKTVSPSTDKTYYVTVSDGNGCSKVGSVFVDVKSVPEATAAGGLTICSGGSATISATAIGGDAPYTYTWNNGIGTGNTKTVTPATTTNYIVTVTSANGCSDTDQVTIKVNQTPTVNAGPDETICRTFSTTLNGTASGGTAPYTYNWNQGLGVGASQTITPNTTTTYTLSVVSANGCNATDQVTISVQTCVEDCSNGIDDDGDGLIDCADPDCGPITNAGSDVSLCSGTSTFISATATGGSGPYTYAWSNGLGSGQTKSVSPLVSTTYTVTTTSASGCTSIDQVTVTVVVCGEDCTNGIDDDGDGLIDCDDPDCSATGAPVLMDDNYMTCPGMTFSERVTYNDENLQNPLYSIFTYPATGTVTIDHTGKFTYSPVNSDCQTIQFMYQVCNQATGCCSQATVTLTLGDVTSPTLNNVPADVTISCDDAIPLPPNIIAFDECPGIFMDYDQSSTQHFVGACESYTITRTWTATDLCGNETTKTQKITVVDNTKPEIFQVYTLENGARVVAGVVRNVTHDWKYVPFPITFSETPMIFTTVVSNVDQSAVTVRQRNAYSQGFEIRLYEEEANDNLHKGESVSWIAIEPGGSSQDLKLEVGRWQNIDENPVVKNFTDIFWEDPGMITTIQSTNDTDPVNVRISNLTESSVTVQLHEEASADAELDHGLEHVGYLAFRVGEDMTDQRGNTFGETGRTNLTNAWTTINLKNTYTKPVVVFGGLTSKDLEGANVRVRNVTSNSFDVRLQEWDYLDGTHEAECASWIVVEGAIPGNMSYYCSNEASELKVGINVFAMDNCDNQAAFGYTETPSHTSSGTLTVRAWMAIDDCGNTNLITRYDTCSTAALKVKAVLHGAKVNNGNTGLMRDNLRSQNIIPLREPFSKLPAFPHVEDHSHDDHQSGGTSGTGNYGTTVQICHKPGTPLARTLTVASASLPAHLAHGDVLGECVNVLNPGFVTVASGNWTNPATWEGGNVPPTGYVEGVAVQVEHDVTVDAGLTLKENAVLNIKGGALTMTSSKLSVKDAYFNMIDGYLFVGDEFDISSDSAKVFVQNSSVEVLKMFDHYKGEVWLENVNLTVHDEYRNHAVDTLINVVITTEKAFVNQDSARMHLENAVVHVKNYDFENKNNSTMTGDSLIIWVENGNIRNEGIFSVGIRQYCVSLSAFGLGAFLPLAEDCSGMADHAAENNGLLQPELVPIEPAGPVNTSEVAGPGTLDPLMLKVDGGDAIVDWMLLEIRDLETAEILDYATVAMQRDGDIVSEDGTDIINFPNLGEGNYRVAIRHRNHLPLITDGPVFLSIVDPPFVNFADPNLPVTGGDVGGHIINGERMMWGGDFNGDNKVIYQGPNNDIFYLFSRVLSDFSNEDYLANYIVNSYDMHDFNLDGKVIYQGPNNDRASLLYHTVLAHSGNGGFLANYIAKGFLP